MSVRLAVVDNVFGVLAWLHDGLGEAEQYAAVYNELGKALVCRWILKEVYMDA